MKKCLILIFVTLICTSPLFADGTMLLRDPSVSDQHIVFVHANDLWVVDREGGEARRLTSSEGAETNPRISPDGEWVAFTGQYDGNSDVYIVPIIGGEPTRLTWHPGNDVVQDWTPDGESVIFMSGREGYPTANTTFFTVSVDGGTPEKMPIPFGFAGTISPDGTKMHISPTGFGILNGVIIVADKPSQFGCLIWKPTTFCKLHEQIESATHLPFGLGTSFTTCRREILQTTFGRTTSIRKRRSS